MPCIFSYLQVHTGARSIKDSSDRKHQCPKCRKCFFTQKDVRRHMVTHTKAREFMCHFCPQCFGRRDHLVRHLKNTHKQQVDNDQTALTATVDVSKLHQQELCAAEESLGIASLQCIDKYIPAKSANVASTISKDLTLDETVPLPSDDHYTSLEQPSSVLLSLTAQQSLTEHPYSIGNFRSSDPSHLTQNLSAVGPALPNSIGSVPVKYNVTSIQNPMTQQIKQPVPIDMSSSSQPMLTSQPNSITVSQPTEIGSYATVSGNYVVEQPNNYPALIVSYSDAMRMMGQFSEETPT